MRKKRKLTIGIYGIRNKINDKIYIGKSLQVEKRLIAHKSLLNRQVHFNKKLQNSYNKYGAESFEFLLLEEFDINSFFSEEALSAKEQEWINKNIDKLLNIEIDVINSVSKPFSEESKKKMAMAVRTTIGENNGNSKLLTSDVEEIIKLIKEAKISLKEIAELYNIAECTISSINTGRLWSFLTKNEDKVIDRYDDNKEKLAIVHVGDKLDREKVTSIRKLLVEGNLTHTEIGELFGVKRTTISGIANDKEWNWHEDQYSEFLKMKKQEKLKVREEKNNVKKQKADKVKEDKIKQQKMVLEIKYLLTKGELSQKEIADIYDISLATVNSIKQNRNWKWLQGEEDILNKSSKMPKYENVLEIKNLLQEGNLTIAEIAEKFKLSRGTISNIKNQKFWKTTDGTDEDLKSSIEAQNEVKYKQVLEIKKYLKDSTISVTEIAKKFNVKVSYISKISKGKIWAWLKEPE